MQVSLPLSQSPAHSMSSVTLCKLAALQSIIGHEVEVHTLQHPCIYSCRPREHSHGRYTAAWQPSLFQNCASCSRL